MQSPPGAAPTNISGLAPKIFSMSPATSCAARMTNGRIASPTTILGIVFRSIRNGAAAGADSATAPHDEKAAAHAAARVILTFICPPFRHPHSRETRRRQAR